MGDSASNDWKRIISGIKEIQQFFPDGVAFIGGVAVYYYCLSNEVSASFAAFSHDADFVISSYDFPDLKDIEAVTQNRRLGKFQFLKKGIEYDVYEEHSSGLVVPIKEILTHRRQIGGMQLASPEHLLKLKLAAWEDRRGSPKGEKDEDDICRILYVMKDDQLNKDAAFYLDDTDLDNLNEISAGRSVLRLAKENPHDARKIRASIELTSQKLKKFLTEQRSQSFDRPSP